MPDNLEPKYKVKVPKLNAPRRKYDISLSLPGMISIVGVGVLALTFFFVMGILIGRGYRPEADVPQLAVIMPQTQEEKAPETETPPAEILKSEDLEYPKELSQPPAMPAAQAERPAPPAPAKKPETPKPAAPAVTAPSPAPEAAPAAQSGEPTFDYVYQVASFRQENLAKELSDKLVQAGLTSVVSSGEATGSTWYRVLVHHHGTPASTDQMKAVLAKFGIGKPLLKKKTPHGGQ